MRGAALPAALLCAALGLLLACAPRRAVAPALLVLGAAACAASVLPIGGWAIEAAFLGCWVSIILIATATYLPRELPAWLVLIAAGDAGIFAGAVIAGEGARADLLRALPAALICLPTIWIAHQGWRIAIRVVSSWLIAIALLAALLPTAPTPGYQPDHME